MDGVEIKVSNYVVAFIDILGSSEAIMHDADASLKAVHQAYQESLEGFGKIFDGSYLQPSVRIFSDNILVAVPYAEERFKRSAFLAVAMMSAVIQVAFLKSGWLTRGGISSGSFFADSVMVWGTALVKAYEFENTVAVYPRIVVNPALIDELQIAVKIDMKIIAWLRQDKDGLFYIDYINRYLNQEVFFAVWLTKVVEQNVAKYHEKTRICQKWLWLSSYLNERLLELECLGKGNGMTNDS